MTEKEFTCTMAKELETFPSFERFTSTGPAVRESKEAQ